MKNKMRIQWNKRNDIGTRVATVALVVLLVFVAVLGVLDYMIPDSVSLMQGESYPCFLGNGVILEKTDCDGTDICGENSEIYELNGNDPEARAAFSGQDQPAFSHTTKCTAKLLGIIPVKQVAVHEIEDRLVVPGGMLFGVKMYTEGVLVIGVHTVQTQNGEADPAGKAGIRVRDVITRVNGRSVSSAEEFSTAVEASQGASIAITVKRSEGEKEFEVPVTPAKTNDGQYKTGVFVRDNTSGIGTVTFIDSETGVFCGLGHGICDVDTGVLLPLSRGTLMRVVISGITQSASGSPGALSGYFAPDKTGSLLGNTPAGVFGVFTKTDTGTQQPMHIGLKDTVVRGNAQIMSTVSQNGECHAYDVTIERITGDNDENKNFIISVTDPALLEQTGGIVQGMSGSPVIQNGRLIGALTHVMVNDPTKGYGIFIENMITAMPQVLQPAA